MRTRGVLATVGLTLIACSQAFAGTVVVNTGGPTSGIAMASRPDSPGKTEIETADDFIIAPSSGTFLTSGTFTGLLTGSVAVPAVQDVTVELYRVFPLDSGPASGNVLTRTNSPSDVAFLSQNAAAGELSFSTQVLTGSFTALNSVQAGGIHPKPNQTTGGNGAVSGEEVQFTFVFATPFLLPADHYFFVPQVQVSGGDFLWLSGDRPLSGTDVGPTPDLQAWTRDAALDPDWSRVGTDIVGGTGQPTFNGAFTLSANVVPEPAAFELCFAALGLVGSRVIRRRSQSGGVKSSSPSSGS